MFLYFVSSNCLCRFSPALTDVHMDTSTKLARRGSLNRVYPQTCQTVWAITLTFWAVYLQLLKLLFHYVKIIPSFKLFFKFIYPVHIISRRVQFGSVIRKFAPSFTIIFSYPLLSQRKISSPCTYSSTLQ